MPQVEFGGTGVWANSIQAKGGGKAVKLAIKEE